MALSPKKLKAAIKIVSELRDEERTRMQEVLGFYWLKIIQNQTKTTQWGKQNQQLDKARFDKANKGRTSEVHSTYIQCTYVHSNMLY